MKIDDRPVTRLEPSSGLRRENFTRISKNGFGDRYNGISHSMSYFQGKVYVGTSRCNLQMIAVNNPPFHRRLARKMPGKRLPTRSSGANLVLRPRQPHRRLDKRLHRPVGDG